MKTIDKTLNFPQPNELNYFFNDVICLGSLYNFQIEFNKKLNLIATIYDNNNIAIKTYHPNFKGLEYPTINLYFNSPGGECYHGLAIHDYIKELDNNKNLPKINIIAQGHVMSMGVPIMLSLPLEQRFAYKNTTFMLHSVSGFVIGCVDEIEDSLTETKRLNEILYNIITENTNITKEQLEHYKERKKDWIIDADTALELGIISKII